MPEKTVKVRVLGKSRVVHADDGTPYSSGDELNMPEAIAQQWQRSGFVEQVTKEK